MFDVYFVPDNRADLPRQQGLRARARDFFRGRIKEGVELELLCPPRAPQGLPFPFCICSTTILVATTSLPRP